MSVVCSVMRCSELRPTTTRLKGLSKGTHHDAAHNDAKNVYLRAQRLLRLRVIKEAIHLILQQIKQRWCAALESRNGCLQRQAETHERALQPDPQRHWLAKMGLHGCAHEVAGSQRNDALRLHILTLKLISV